MRFSIVVVVLFVVGRVWGADVDAGDDDDCTMRVGVDEGMPVNQLLVQVDDGILDGHLGIYRGTPNECRAQCVELGCYVFEYTVSSQECFLYESYQPIGGVIKIIRKPRQKVIFFIVEADGPFDDIEEGPITEEQLKYMNDRYLSAYNMDVAAPICGSPTDSTRNPWADVSSTLTTLLDSWTTPLTSFGDVSTPDGGLTTHGPQPTPAVSDTTWSSSSSSTLPATTSFSPTPTDLQTPPLSTNTPAEPITSTAQPPDSTTKSMPEITSATTPADMDTSTTVMTTTSGKDDRVTSASTPEKTTPQESTSSSSSSSPSTTTTVKPVPAGMVSFNNNRFVVKYGQIFALPAVAASARDLQVNTFKGCTVFVTLKNGTEMVKPYRTEPYTDTVDGVIAVTATCE